MRGSKKYWPVAAVVGLFSVLLALKITQQIDWSWSWVLSPLWSVVAIAGILALAALAFAGLILLMAVVCCGVYVAAAWLLTSGDR